MSTLNTVWAVEGSHDYADTQLIAIYSTEEAAAACAKLFERQYDDVWFHEWPIDGEPAYEVRTL